MGMDEKKIINASGFPFQIKVKELIEKQERLNWKVESIEHRWDYNGKSGFIDIIAGQYTTQRLVIECKRDRKPWFFLVEEENKFTDFKTLYRYGGDSPTDMETKYLWWDFELFPDSYSSKFCVVEGQGVKGQPMLERICDDVLLSTEALLFQEFKNQFSGNRKWYFPMIVTNTNLFACFVDSSKIDVISGELDEFKKKEVPYIRFKKPLFSSINPEEILNDFEELNRFNSRTILIVNASHLADVLKEWSIQFKQFDRPPGYRNF